jgi:hypothetical protein
MDWPSTIQFTTGGLFDAVSFDIPSAVMTYWVQQVEDPWEQIGTPYNNVGVYGTRDSTLVASAEISFQSTYLGQTSMTYLFPDTFKGIDALVIEALNPPHLGLVDVGFGTWVDGSGCFANECTAFNVDNVTLTNLREAPAVVPLPAGLPLLATGLGGLWLIKRRRRAAQ